MSDQDDVSGFGANAVDPGLGTDEDDDSVDDADDGREEIEMEPEFRRCTRAEAMGIESSDDDEGIDED
ncbi:hypothetical protein [Halorubrum laminariae]|uniref:Uncharacterized protein n=1 Tax=Halorubrum laminariae TaxID=1433523 RepID=A0ABD6BXX5_9EURY|nr:hypothetical protein [Halorubrum laminariae]